jgi:hypothetical protein
MNRSNKIIIGSSLFAIGSLLGLYFLRKKRSRAIPEPPSTPKNNITTKCFPRGPESPNSVGAIIGSPLRRFCEDQKQVIENELQRLRKEQRSVVEAELVRLRSEQKLQVEGEIERLREEQKRVIDEEFSRLMTMYNNLVASKDKQLQLEINEHQICCQFYNNMDTMTVEAVRKQLGICNKDQYEGYILALQHQMGVPSNTPQ